MQATGCKSQAMFVEYFARAKSYFILLCILLLSPKQPIGAVISSSDVPVANLSPLQSNAGIMVQANYTEFGLERAGRSCTKLSLQFFSLWGSSLWSVSTNKPRDPSPLHLKQLYHQSDKKQSKASTPHKRISQVPRTLKTELPSLWVVVKCWKC